MQLPKVSIVIACYNNQQFIHDAIYSALSQTYPDIDVWLCDDASTEDIKPQQGYCLHDEIDWMRCRKDEVGTYLRYEYDSDIQCNNGRKHPRQLYYIRLKKNSGPSVARNIAIANAIANGSHLIQVLDSDDMMYPNKVSELIKPIMLDPERVAVTYADYNIIRDNGTVHYESKPVYDLFRLMNGDCMIHSGSLVNILAIKDRLPYIYEEDMLTCEDYYLWKYILRQHWVAYHIPKPLTYVRSHNNSSVNYRSKEIWERNYAKCMQLH